MNTGSSFLRSWLMGLLALAFVVGAAGAGEGAVGKWKFDLEGRQGPAEVVVEIVEGDGGLAGTWTGPRGVTQLQDVSFAGGELKFTRTVESPQGEFELDFIGKIDGDAIDGKLVTPRGERPMKGTRVE